MNPQGPHIIAARTNDKLQKLQQWRGRYQDSEYPSKVAINVTLEALVTEEKHSYYENSFGNSKVQDLEAGVEKVGAKEKEIRDRVVTEAEGAYETRPNIGSLQLDGLRSKVDVAADGDNSAVEDLEFSLVYYGGVFELFTGWYAAGLCGLSREQAMVAMTGQSIRTPSEIQAVEGYFSDYTSSVLEQIDVYQQLPALW
jgi:cell division protein ZapA (FtsZ GTPase activity inhibitor)